MISGLFLATLRDLVDLAESRHYHRTILIYHLLCHLQVVFSLRDVATFRTKQMVYFYCFCLTFAQYYSTARKVNEVMQMKKISFFWKLTGDIDTFHSPKLFFFNWVSHNVWLNSHYKTWSYKIKKKKGKKKLFRKIPSIY